MQAYPTSSVSTPSVVIIRSDTLLFFIAILSAGMERFKIGITSFAVPLLDTIFVTIESLDIRSFIEVIGKALSPNFHVIIFDVPRSDFSM